MDVREYGLILANDITDPEKALKVSEEVAPYLDAIKIGVTTTLRPSVSFITKVKERTNKPVVADFKVADVGVMTQKGWDGTNAKIVGEVASAGADYIICHTIVGTSSIQESIEVAHSKGSKVLTLPYMTHKGAELFFGMPINRFYTRKALRNLGITSIEERINDAVTVSDLILLLGEYYGVDGYIGPANLYNEKGELGIIKRYRQFTTRPIFTPGIGRQNVGPYTPQQQLENLYNTAGKKSALIIGSAIYAAQEPAKAAQEFSKWRDSFVSKSDV